MIEKIARSPLSNIFLILLLGAFIFFSGPNSDVKQVYSLLITLGIIIILVLYYLSILVYNHRNPSSKVRLFG
ncbi:putative membrane protein YkvI [Gracilibacillus halotolerans]|uniref:Putative membrane protein YkvI n=1 Tax=Gracilibacillus halotolerans TaxID=74386 RepID=A0A841RSA5_9BACI|nr:putative membrane protein YkvI [Gracilibacillus halotolerans]